MTRVNIIATAILCFSLAMSQALIFEQRREIESLMESIKSADVQLEKDSRQLNDDATTLHQVADQLKACTVERTQLSMRLIDLDHRGLVTCNAAGKGKSWLEPH